MLLENQKKELLAIARKTLEIFLSTGKIPEFTIDDPVLNEERGVFVTLHKNGALRGCIGYILPIEPLYQAVSKMAIESASGDPRFKPVTKEELPELEIEISVLSVPERASKPEEIIMGTHGVIVKRAGRSGVFLPQVAAETCWSREEFLDNLCAHKACLPKDAWRDKNTELYTFTAEVFNEGRCFEKEGEGTGNSASLPDR